jgi:hypothetical protein
LPQGKTEDPIWKIKAKRTGGMTQVPIYKCEAFLAQILKRKEK